MPYNLSLPQSWLAQGWKAKIRDRERLEPPHVTLIRGRRSWRISLRTGQFLDDEPDPADVPKDLVDAIAVRFSELHNAWDDMYPENPVQSTDAKDE